MRGAEMEAHAGTIRIPSPTTTTKPRRRWRLLELLRELSKTRKQRAIQTHDGRLRSIPGSEHSHLVLPPKAY
jgi:hypothetical protein